MANPPLILFPLPTRLRLVEELLAADWQPDPEEQRQAVRWPLRLLTAQVFWFFSEPHRLFRRVVSAPARGCPLLHSSSGGGARTGSVRRPLYGPFLSQRDRKFESSSLQRRGSNEGHAQGLHRRSYRYRNCPRRPWIAQLAR